MRLDPRVDHERAGAAPVLLAKAGAETVDVGRRVRAGESDPEQVVQRPRGELGIVDHDDQRKTAYRVVRPEGRTERRDAGIVAPIRRSLHHKDARQGEPRCRLKTLRQA